MDDDPNELLEFILAEARPVTKELVRDSRGIETVSMVAIIANPAAYHAKKVRFTGYLHLSFEHNAIYLHHEDLLNFISKNALWIEMPEDMWLEKLALSNQYVICQGTLRADLLGHMAMNSGTIHPVEVLEPRIVP